MISNSHWQFAEALTLNQIALLLNGYDPSDFSNIEYENWPSYIKKNIYSTTETIRGAVLTNKISLATCEYEPDFEDRYIDFFRSRIDINSLKIWLSTKGYTDCLFFHDAKVDAENPVSDPQHPQYAPKLAAAYAAWQAVTADPALTNGKTPKQALSKWLKDHAADYGLTNADGSPNETGIEEITKVANWKPQGGASPTRVALPNPPVGSTRTGGRAWKNPPVASSAHDFDDEIPF